MDDASREKKVALLIARRKELEAVLCDLETYSEMLMGRIAVTRYLIEVLLD